MTRREAAEYKTMVKAMTDNELFEEWSLQYDAQNTDRVMCIVDEMNVRKLGGVIQL